MSNEQWRPLTGWEGLYEASPNGHIRSVPRRLSDGRWWAGKVLTPSQGQHGYLVVDLHRDGKKVQRRVHRLLARTFLGPRPPGTEVRHLNGDPADNRIDNLEYGTHSDNMQDMLRHGRHRSARKTHCPRGHLLQAPNLVAHVAKRGHRSCLACHRAHAWIQRHPDLQGQLQQLSDNYYLKIQDHT